MLFGRLDRRMIYGMGTDVIEISRIRQASSRHGNRLALRVLSQREFEEWSGMSEPRRMEYLAGRFALKEAIAKAAGVGLGRLRMNAVDIHVCSSGLCVSFSTDLVGQAVWVQQKWHVSLSHTGSVAFAVAVCEQPAP
ncbi:holo-[acyl-carrier-protein] synthase [Alicyclobacillaceae bacterium I2511]|nr:holo-[acyl-carrier-protein] synthase [Alicyclobacillaceae bacterium I2511]